MSTQKKVSFHTLGCKLNFSETSSIQKQFEDAGYLAVDFENDATDVVVINTCSVTDFADRKCRKAIRTAKKNSPGAKVIMTGCYAQLKPDEISKMADVDMVLGAAEKFRILDHLGDLSNAHQDTLVEVSQIKEVNGFNQAFSTGQRTRSFLKVQDGCDYKCSFCTIPLARGKSRSDSIENVVSNARKLGESGVKEIVLTGVNIGDYGLKAGDVSKRFANFLDLIQELEKVEEIARYRISSIEPNLCSNEIIDFVSSSQKFVPHFHMPLQSGSNELLQLMRRRYKSELYKDRVEYIKSIMPDCCIGVDVIVGFPGESDGLFEETYNFLLNLDITYLHVFTYSERANTKAIDLGSKVDMHERRLRNKSLTELSLRKKNLFYQQHLGTTRPVLFEKSKVQSLITGFTDNYIKVSYPYDEQLINTIGHVELNRIDKRGRVEVKLAEKAWS